MGETSVWESRCLRDLVTFEGGYSFPDRFQGQPSGELPFFKVSDMNAAGNERTLRRARHYVMRSLAVTQAWQPMPTDAVVFAKVGAALLLNRRRLLSQQSLIDNNLLAAVAGGEVHPGWLYWWLQTVDFGLFVQPGAVPSVNQELLGALSVSLPPAAEQRRIAEILNTLDEAIRKTEQLIAKLKQVKQGLLHDLLTRGIDDNGELRDPVRAPEQFKDSAIGRIPNAWDPASLGPILTSGGGFLQTGPFGSQLHSHEYVDEGVPLVMPQDIDETRISTAVIARISSSKALELGRHRLAVDDVVFARRGDLSRAAAISAREVGWICGTGCLLARVPAKTVNARWLRTVYRHDLVQRQIIGRAVGSTMANLNTSILASLRLPLPSRAEQDEIDRRVSARDDLQSTEEATLEKLRLLKQGLMEDLLTGRVRVTNLVGEAAA